MSAPQGLPGIMVSIVIGVTTLSVWGKTESWGYTLLTLIGLIALALILGWHLYVKRYYKAVDGKAYVKEGKLGDWEELEDHIKKEHPEIKL